MRFFLLFFLLFSGTVTAQQFSIYYKELRVNKLDRMGSVGLLNFQNDEDYEQLSQNLPDQEKLLKYGFRSVVRIDNEKSVYYPLDSIGNDYYENKYFVPQDKLQLRSRIITHRNYSIIYLDLLDKKQISTEVVNDHKFLIKENLPTYRYISDDSTRVINNYKCNVALLDPINCNCSDIAHKHYKEIWYTKEIPSNMGPMGYWGLPGLVMEVLTNEYHIYFDKMIYSLEDVKVVPPTSGEPMDRSMIQSYLFFQLGDN